MRRGRNSHVIRTIAVIRHLSTRPYTIADLATAAGIDLRSAYRYVRALEASGVRLATTRLGGHGGPVEVSIPRGALTARPEPRCSRRGCDRPVQARRLCHAHYVRRWIGNKSKRPILRLHRLTDKQVRAARRRYRAGGVSMTSLAIDYGVARVTMQRILHRTRRKDA